LVVLVQRQQNQAYTNDQFEPVVRRRTVAAKAAPAEPELPEAQMVDRTVYFSKHYNYNHDKYETAAADLHNQQRLPANLVCPISVPWLPAGRAYAVLDPELFNHLRGHLKPHEIEALLMRGNVEGRHNGRGTGTAIVGSTDGYQNIHGSNIQAANFKMKFTNNIRVYARQLQETNQNGHRYLLYIFDGIGFGH
jgi:hypothetical protein